MCVWGGRGYCVGGEGWGVGGGTVCGGEKGSGSDGSVWRGG